MQTRIQSNPTNSAASSSSMFFSFCIHYPGVGHTGLNSKEQCGGVLQLLKVIMIPAF